MNRQQRDGVSKNFIYQFLYQVVIMVIPLIVSPYLTRTLGSKALGIYTYVNSIALYFVMFANLGITKHGQRIVAQNRNDSKKLSRVFWSLFLVHVILSLISTIAFFTLAILNSKEYRSVYYIQTIYVFSALFDITWVFYGLENFRNVVIRNVIVRIIESILIFTFVKSPDDLLIYTAIYSVGNLVGQAVMLPQAIKMMPLTRFSKQDMALHIKPLFVFAISVFAVSLYTIFDKILLGLMTVEDNVAYYEYANRIISLPKTFIIIIGTVMFPRACKLAAEGDLKGQKRYLGYSLKYTYFLGMASLFGLLAISNKLAVLYYGSAFAETGTIMMSMSAIPVILGLGDIMRTQYMIPNGLDKQYTICIIINAVINLILSVALIPVLGVYGAVIGTCYAELFGCLYQCYLCRKYVSFKEIFLPSIPYAVFGALMYLVLLVVKQFTNNTIASLLLEVAIGGIIYLLLVCLYLYRFDKSFWRELTGRLPFAKRLKI